MAKRIRPDSESAFRPEGGEMDVAGVRRALVKRRASIIAPTMILTAAAVAFVTLSTPRYAGEARVLLESRVNFLNRPDGSERDQTQQNAFDSEGVLSQVQVVTSNDLAREAIKRLKLVGNPEFDPSAGSLNPVGRIMTLLGLSRDVTDRSVEDRVLQAYYDRLSAFPVGKSRVVGIEFSSRDPELAARGANTIADLYLDAVTAAKKDLARSAGSWLSGNIEELRKRVRDAEAKVEDFRSRNGLFSAGRDTTLPQQQLAEAATQLSQAKTQQADAQAKAQLIRDMIRSGRVFEITEVSNNELIRRLIEQRVTLRAQLALESRTLGAAHPRLKELAAQIADVETQIRAAAERTARGMENDARVAGARVAQLAASLDEQKKRSAEGLENDVQLRALEREAKTLRDQLESYLAKYREAVARDTDNAQPADARIISRAVTPSRPAFPKKIPIVLLTALASLVIFSAIAVTRELMGDGARRMPAEGEAEPAAGGVAPAAPMAKRETSAERAIEPATGSAAPAVMAPAAREAPAEAQAAPSSDVGGGVAAADIRPEPVSEGRSPLDALLARIGDGSNGEGLRFAIVGADRAEAGAFVAIFAKARAAHGRAVLVALSGAIAPANYRGAGLLDLARGDASFAEIIHRAQQSTLHVIPRGEGDLDDALADPDAADMIFASLADTYETVVIDCPFDLSADACAVLAAHVDMIAILCRGEEPDADTATLFTTLRAKLGRDPLVVLLPPGEAELQAA